MSYRWWPERWTTGRLMIWVAIGSTVLGAWAFSRSHGTSDRAWANHNARALLNAPTPGERADSAQVLGGLLGFGTAGPSALDALVASSGGDAAPSVRAASVHALGRSFDVASIEPIRRSLADPSAEVRLAALLAMARSRPFRDLTERDPAEAESMASTARRSLADPDASTRRAALALLTALPGVVTPGKAQPEPRGRVEALAMFERDPDRANRELAMRRLVSNWPDRSLYAPLIRRLRSADDPEERATIAWLMDMLPAPSADTLATLVGMMDRDVALSPMVAAHLERLGRASAAPYLPALALAACREAEGHAWASMPACFALFRLDPDSADAEAVADALGQLAALDPSLKDSADAALRARARALAVKALRDMEPAP